MPGALLGLIGLVCVLVGVRLLSGGLVQSAGARLTRRLQAHAGRPAGAFLVGLAFSAAVHSSAATNVAALALVEAGALDLRRALAVVLGANVGTTLTAQMVAWTPFWLAWPALVVGVALAGLANARSAQGAGRALAGFGGILFGLQQVTEAVAPLLTGPLAAGLNAAAASPAAGVAAGALLTALMQSSGALTSALVGLGESGGLPLAAGVALALGSNLGTVSTTLWAAIGSRRPARAVALADLLFNAAGVLIALAAFPAFLQAAARSAAQVDRQIANAHTLFNLITASLAYPLLGPVAGWLAGKGPRRA